MGFLGIFHVNDPSDYLTSSLDVYMHQEKIIKLKIINKSDQTQLYHYQVHFTVNLPVSTYEYVHVYARKMQRQFEVLGRKV